MSNQDEQIQRNQDQVREITQVMQQNMQNILERDINLENLNKNADNLNNQANVFQTTSHRTKNRFKCKNTKWTIIVIIVVLLAIGIIALGLGVGLNK